MKEFSNGHPIKRDPGTPLLVKLAAWFTIFLVSCLITMLVLWGILAIWNQIEELL